jgi:hypothetical protein
MHFEDPLVSSRQVRDLNDAVSSLAQQVELLVIDGDERIETARPSRGEVL